MPLLSGLASLWRNLLQKNRVEQALTEEVQAYLEMFIELKIKDGVIRPEQDRLLNRDNNQRCIIMKTSAAEPDQCRHNSLLQLGCCQSAIFD